VSAVLLPTVLRSAAGGQKQLDIDGSTVGQVIGGLVDRHPGLREQLFSTEGELNRFVNVYLNDQDVRYLQGLETPVAERDSIRILPAMAGGER
jgi:molybdopterin synthase sulfur carrier subunit